MKKETFQPIAVAAAIIFVTFLWYKWTFCLSKDSSTDLGTTVLFGTALAIMWYTYETYKLRLETQKSNEFRQTPVLTLRIDDGANPTMQIKNDSDVIAYDINFMPFEVGGDSGVDIAEFAHIFYIDNGNQYIEPRTTPTLSLISLKKPDGMSKQQIELYRILHLMTIYEKKIIILIHFKNSLGQKYYLVYKLYSLVDGLTKPALQFIQTGKGEINYAEAKELTRLKEPQLNPTYNLLRYLGRDTPLE